MLKLAVRVRLGEPPGVNNNLSLAVSDMFAKCSTANEPLCT